MPKQTYLYLIIYILLQQGVFSQNFRLKIKGETTKETAIIDTIGYEKNHLNYKSIKSEIDLVQLKLNRKGYLQNKIAIIEKENDSTFIAFFSLGAKTNAVHVYYNNILISKKTLELITKKYNTHFFVLPINQVEKALNIINSEIINNGFPFSTVNLIELKKGQNQVLEAQLSITNHTKGRTISKILVKGYDNFPTGYLKHFLKIKWGNQFNLEEITKKINVLSNVNFVSQIKEPEVLFTKDSTHVYLYLKKEPSNTFDGFLGFGTNKESNKLELDGYLNLNLNNNLNYGESLNLFYKSDENSQKTFHANVNLPYLFKSPLGIHLNLNIFKQDSSFTTASQNAKLFYQINSKHKIAFGISSLQSENLLNTNSLVDIQDFNSSFYNLSYNYVKLQNRNTLFKTASLFEFELGFGSRQVTNNTENQSTFKIDASKIFNLNTKTSIYVRLNSAGLASKYYLENELFRIGGINSVRGFEENSITTSFYGLVNTEYRLRLDSNIYIHSIIDVAYLENNITNQKIKLYGLGIGFGILTKSGLIRFIYANGKNENNPFNFQNSKVHLSLTSSF